MPRRKLGSIKKLGEDRWAVSIESKRDGKRHRPTVVVRGSERDAELQLARMLADSGKWDGADMTLEEFWNAVYEPSIAHLAPHTQSGYRYAWDGTVRPLFGDRRMSAMKAGDIERGLAAIGAPGTQQNAYKLLRQMFNMAYRDEMIDANPFSRRIRIKRQPAYRPEVLLLDDVPAWLDAIRGSALEPVLLAMLLGGLRREEACALFWEDIEIANGRCAVKVDKALTEVRGTLVEGPTKTAESTRTVFIAGYGAERLSELRGTGPLVPDSNGNRMRPDRMSRLYRKLMDEKGAKYVPMKNLRTSYATIMQGLGASDSLISRALGHTNLRVDYDHYFAANAPAQMGNAELLARHVVERCGTFRGVRGKRRGVSAGQDGGPSGTRTPDLGIKSGSRQPIDAFAKSIFADGGISRNSSKTVFPTKMRNDVERNPK